MPALAEPIALFVDLDGTLIDIAPTPAAVKVSPLLLQTLAALAPRLDGALACISGRAFGDLARLLQGAGIALVGSHGAELLQAAPADARLAALALRCRQALQPWPGALVEEKPCGLALHWRQAPEAEAMIRELGAQLAAAMPTHGLCEGRKVLEWLPAHVDKGTALQQLMQQRPYHGRVPVFIGDDTSDISAMQAARALGGLAFAVGGRVAAHADGVFARPANVLAWLQLQVRIRPT